MYYFFILLSFFYAEIALSDMTPPEKMRKTQEVVLTGKEKKLAEQLNPRLFGGRRIRENELRPSVYIGNCTATIVGPETIITAGHCRSSGSSASFTYGRTRYSGRCTRHPDYSKNGWLNNDFAMCKFSPSINMPVWGTLKPTEIKVGDIVVMQGYGAGSNGYLNVGTAPIVRINYMDIITQNSVHLGGGDSGGGLFKSTPDLVNGPFIIVGINSRGGGNTSLFNITSLDRSQSFFKKWASDNETEVCGINKDCLGGDPEPDPDKCPVEFSIVNVIKDELSLAEKNLKACLEAH